MIEFYSCNKFQNTAYPTYIDFIWFQEEGERVADGWEGTGGKGSEAQQKREEKEKEED